LNGEELPFRAEGFNGHMDPCIQRPSTCDRSSLYIVPQAKTAAEFTLVRVGGPSEENSLGIGCSCSLVDLRRWRGTPEFDGGRPGDRFPLIYSCTGRCAGSPLNGSNGIPSWTWVALAWGEGAPLALACLGLKAGASDF
jgi:hypothetical protein